MEAHYHTHFANKRFKEYRKPVSAFLFMLFFHSVIAQKQNNDVAIIKSFRSASNEAIAKHDVDGIAKYWLDDFVQVIGRGIYQTGRDSIMASWRELFSTNPQVGYIREPKEIVISNNDTLAWEQGKWIGIHSYSKGGNYAAMWIKRNGNWRLKAELFVSLEATKQ